jgi:uncharacterized protein (DUF1697 family)
MAALRELLVEHGYADVRTHLQSGNVVLESAVRGKALESALERQFADGLGFAVDVFVRTGAELRAIVDRSPLEAAATDPSRYLVTFLRAKPSAALAKRIAAIDLAPELVAARGREIYSWHPNGVGRSELAKQLTERALGTTATARNWKTVEKLLELASL